MLVFFVCEIELIIPRNFLNQDSSFTAIGNGFKLAYLSSSEG